MSDDEQTLADIPIERLVPRDLIDPRLLEELRTSGYQTLADIDDAPVDELAQRDRLDAERASELKEEIRILAVESDDLGDETADDYDEWRTEKLGEELRRAELRASAQLQATITDVTLEDDGDTVRLALQYTDDTSGIEVTAEDRFELPQVATDESAFVRLCADLHIPFESAHEKLVGTSVPIRWEDEEWQIVVEEPETADSRNWSDVAFVVALALPVGAVFPLVAPFIFLGLWGDEGLPVAAGVTVGGVVVWLVLAGCSQQATEPTRPREAPQCQHA